MIGIYKITNNINGKIYIGQSIDIYKRWSFYRSSHLNLSYRSAIINAIQKYGLENFTFEVIEECPEEKLNEREMYYIALWQTNKTGYNLTAGGDTGKGESNANAVLTEEDVRFIRELYNSKTTIKKYDIYQEYFSNKCSYTAFNKVWLGTTWSHVMPEVFTEENKNYYKHQAKGKKGQDNINASMTDEEVMIIRTRYQNETTKQILKDYPYLSYSGLEKILLGTTYTHLPIYSKRQKRWITK